MHKLQQVSYDFQIYYLAYKMEAMPVTTALLLPQVCAAQSSKHFINFSIAYANAQDYFL